MKTLPTIYCDFETDFEKGNDRKFNQKSSDYSMVIVSNFQDIFSNKIIQRQGKFYEETLYLLINDIKNLQSTFYNTIIII